MKVVGLDGTEYSLNFATAASPRLNCSKLHSDARKLLELEFPFDEIHEEVTIPGTGGLSVDFMIGSRRIIVEVQGEQHYKFNNFHFVDKAAFLAQQNRDRKKRKWCELNRMILIELPYNEKEEKWLDRILRGKHAK